MNSARVDSYGIELAGTEELEILYGLAHDLARSSDTEAMAGHLFARATHLLEADTAFLMGTDAGDRVLRGIAAFGMDAETFRQERIELNAELAPVSRTFQTKQPVVIPDVTHSPFLSERLRETYHFLKSVWIVPLMNGQEAEGIFAVGYTTQREASPKALRLLQLLGDEAAPALVRARLTEKLRESETRFSAVAEASLDAFYIFRSERDAAGRIVDFTFVDLNTLGEQLISRPREMVIGRRLCELLPINRMAGFFDRYVQVVEAGQALSEEVPIPEQGAAQGIAAAWVQQQIVPLADGVAIISRDITVRKELEQQRADFIAMLTHDIKNPLGVILGYTELLLEAGRERGPDEEGMLEKIQSNAHTVHALVANYLDLSRIEAGQQSLTQRLLRLGELLTRVTQQYQGEARRRHLSLDLQLQPELPLVEGDPLALERVFANLVHNALKFTPESGRVTLSSEQQNGWLVVSVADTGAGIAPEEVATVFDRYQQGTAGQSQAGTGLGLFIVKTLVAAHGGKVKVESTVGKGCCFSVYLPMASVGQARR